MKWPFFVAMRLYCLPAVSIVDWPVSLGNIRELRICRFYNDVCCGLIESLVAPTKLVNYTDMLAGGVRDTDGTTTYVGNNFQRNSDSGIDFLALPRGYGGCCHLLSRPLPVERCGTLNGQSTIFAHTGNLIELMRPQATNRPTKPTTKWRELSDCLGFNLVAFETQICEVVAE